MIGFLRRLLELHLEYVDQVERELAPRDEAGRPASRRPERGEGEGGVGIRES